MGFSSKRGRPRKVVSGKLGNDLGTEQLQAKRRSNATIEVFDLLLQKSILSEDEHRAGMHLRWLFTLKNGAPNISAARLDDCYGRDIRPESEDWRESREGEYDAALEALKGTRTMREVMDTAVYGTVRLPLTAVYLSNLRDGLRLLCKIWRRGSR